MCESCVKISNAPYTSKFYTDLHLI